MPVRGRIGRGNGEHEVRRGARRQVGWIERDGRQVGKASCRERNWAGEVSLELDGEGVAGRAAGDDGLGGDTSGAENKVCGGGGADANTDQCRYGSAMREVDVSTVERGECVSALGERAGGEGRVSGGQDWRGKERGCAVE